MQRRKQTLDKFSTFLVLTNADIRGTRWTIDNKLKRNLERIISEKEIKAELLARKFLTIIKSNKNTLCSLHLSAYLQEVGYFASCYVFNKFSGLITEFCWQDYFGFAMEKIAQPDILLYNYNENIGVQIITYVQNRLQGKIANDVYAHIGWRLCSDWGLLKKMSKRAGKKALQEIGGFTDTKLEEYLCIWECFTVIYNSQNRQNSGKLSKPTQEELRKMTTQYNLMTNHQIKVEDFKEMLSKCIEIARKYQNPQTVSYPENFEPVNDVIDISMEEDDKTTQVNQLGLILTEAIELLTQEEQLLLQLSKGLKITQQDIVKVFANKYPDFVSQQYQVSRKIERARKKMLEYAIKKCLNNNSKISPEMLENSKIPFYDWLQKYYKDIINKYLGEVYKKNEFSEENILNDQEYLQQFLLIELKSYCMVQWQVNNDNYDFLNNSLKNLVDVFLQDEYIGY